MNVTNRNQSLVKSEIRHDYFIRLTICFICQKHPGSTMQYLFFSLFSVLEGNTVIKQSTHLTTSTAPALTLGSLPMMDTLAVNDPSILNTTHSVLAGTTVR